jgi:cytochrome c-type biogenesis protein CcmH
VALFLAPAALRAQHVENPQQMPVIPRTALERELRHEIICMCGTCGRKRIGECTCPVAAEMREKIAQLVAEGKTREQIYDYYIAKYGSQEPLASPINKGFNRLAWLFPYVLGASGAGIVGFVAMRWSKRESDAAASATVVPTNEDSALRARLENELRDLD